MAPYKAPERNLPDNIVFNNHLSVLCILSEHAIGFLKGRFQSLKNLRPHIHSRTSHILATYWVAACIGIHAFATRHEREERGLNVDEEINDPFIDEGLSVSDDESNIFVQPNTTRAATCLQQGKLRREQLKNKLLKAKLQSAKY